MARPNRFPTLIRDARKRLGWTQEQLSAASGVSRSTIIRWEQGATVPEPAQLGAVAAVLDIPYDQAYAALGWRPPVEQAGDAPFELRDDAEREIWAARSLNADEKVELITYRRVLREVRPAGG